jgi:hypothetical protein
MKFLLSIAVLAATWTGFAQGTTEAILSYSNNVPITAPVTDRTAGWTFQMANSEPVTELGCFAYIFTNYPSIIAIQVGLWNDSGSLLASNSISPGSTLINESRYESITPVSLDPGQTYHLGLFYSDGTISLDVAGVAAEGTIFSSPAILFLAAASSSAGFAFPAEEPQTQGSIYAGPNFRYGVPEPSSWLLLSLGGLFLTARRGRQRF